MDETGYRCLHRTYQSGRFAVPVRFTVAILSNPENRDRAVSFPGRPYYNSGGFCLLGRWLIGMKLMKPQHADISRFGRIVTLLPGRIGLAFARVKSEGVDMVNAT